MAEITVKLVRSRIGTTPAQRKLLDSPVSYTHLTLPTTVLV